MIRQIMVQPYFYLARTINPYSLWFEFIKSHMIRQITVWPYLHLPRTIIPYSLWFMIVTRHQDLRNCGSTILLSTIHQSITYGLI